MAVTSAQKYLAEFIGTFALLLFGVGSAVFSLALPSTDPAARVVLISLTFGLVLAALAWAFGDLSGGHFNPAVTISMAVSGRLPLRDVVPYLVAQIVGGILGVAVVLGIVLGGPSSFITSVQGSALTSQGYSGNSAPYFFSLGAVFLIELVLTFVFILVIQLVTHPESPARNLAPLAIGGALLVANLVAIPVDGASLNPMRSFAPALLALHWSGTNWALDESWLFWVAPILGGILAALAERVLKPR
jgi:aquaporin Z